MNAVLNFAGKNLLRHVQSKQHNEAPEKVKQILEETTTPDITNKILSFLN